MSHLGDHYHLAAALLKKGDLKGAIAEYRAALRLDHNEAHARYNLAIALQTKGDLVSARKEYKKALKMTLRTSESEARIKSIKSVLRTLAGVMR